ncbi:MAG: FadR family transcriptional regulator [Boseongicola sp. SB0673_bin_14]|nr:GntR family transcriptional regulator [Boseongicola sp.]MXW85955.1 FadR family transcriptional regulator [Boseongicola sp. SB0667_bin_21]MYI69525.1 FadR family transcriptional regulator [Boseongicola sp. SB0673_bin_14]
MSNGTTDRVYQEIRNLLRSGDIAPGQRIPNERRLAEMNHASRAQVRDALLMLQQDGLVERKIGSGTYLSMRAPQIIELAEAHVAMSPERSHDFHETLEARLMIEPPVAARAAEAPTREFVAELDAALERILDAPTWLQFKEEIYGFSRLYYVEAGNGFLCWTFDQIVSTRRANKFDGGTEKAPVANLVRKHFHERLSRIAEAIKSEDPDRARLEVEGFLVGMAASSAL